jgi:hypothetical protein
MKRLGALFLGLTTVLASPGAHADPTKDECINANESAQTLRMAGKLRDARDNLTLCVSESCPEVLRRDCAERLNEVQKALPTVVFEIRTAGGDDLSAVRVQMDGAPLAAKLDGTATVVDPGPHAFTFQAAGFAAVAQPILVREGDKARIVSVVMRSNRPQRTSATRVLSFATLGVGVAGIAVGSVFGILALDDKAWLDDNCKGHACQSSAQSHIRDLHTNAVASEIGFGVGVLGVVAGAVLFLVSRGSGEAAEMDASTVVVPWIGAETAGVQGTF